MTDWNTHFKRIRKSLNLTRQQVAEICAAGGLTITASHADSWARSASNRRLATAMTEAEFEAFTSGLPEWMTDGARETTPLTDPRPFADVLRDWKSRHGLTNETAASALGVGRSGLAKWLAGPPPPSETAYRALMTAIDRGEVGALA